ncbi:MAG: redoxin domain-containing protein [Planctomycetes bacterium]|nr:redoxin domain-containing protein [Planctomycetota bacterium]
MPSDTSSLGVSRFLLLAVAAVGVAVGVGWAAGKLRPARHSPAPTNPPPTPLPATNRGEMLFGVYCASCHGHEGAGDGMSAVTLRPPPRDFAARPWRFAVTRESIRQVTLDGIPGTAMASMRAALTSADVDAIVEYVYHLATSRPLVVHEPTEDERLLREAGFIDMRGVDPPSLVVADGANKEVKLSDLKGKVVLLHFWGTSCVHCVKELPRLKEFEASLAGRKFTVLHITADADNLAEAQTLVDKVAPGLRVFADGTGLSPARFEVQVLPTVWLIGADGKVIGRAHGMKDWSAPTLRRLIEHSLPIAKQ